MNAYRCTLEGGIDVGAYTARIGDEPYTYLQPKIMDGDIWKGTDGININSLNGNVVIGNNVAAANWLFLGTNFTGNVIIGRNVNYIMHMFAHTTSNYTGNIYILGNTYRKLNAWSMFTNCGRERKNLYFNSVLNNCFNISFLDYNGVSWEDIPNGFYNSYYQIYCYNNFSGEV